MPQQLFSKHQATLQGALTAIAERGYWSAYSESPSPKIYGENALENGKEAYEALLNKPFDLAQAGQYAFSGKEVSPYGPALGISYSQSDIESLITAGEQAMLPWQRLGVDGRTGICLEMLARLNQASFEIAHAVMMTTGQGWMMAFQAGGAHAQERGLEAVAYAYREQKFIPEEAIWEKAQGKNPPLRMRKKFSIVGRGVAVVVGCSTFPTWNTYPGLFAALATGNAVIIKPHHNAILPVAISVRIMRQVLREYGLPADLITMAVLDDYAKTRQLVTHPAVKSIDFTGGNKFGEWLRQNCQQAQVYAELAGVNTMIIDSTDDYQAMLKNIAFTLCLYSGQMCTTTQAILVPAQGIKTNEGDKSFASVGGDLAKAIEAVLAKPEVAVLGAIQSPDTVKRISSANNGDFGRVILAAQSLTNPDFPAATVRTPVLIAIDDANDLNYRQERFGPISFVVAVPDTAAAIKLAEDIVSREGALTLALYSSDVAVIESTVVASWQAKVALSINLTSGVFVNQSAAYSDYHGTGANPAANASYTDSAFVANRFRVVQRRCHI